MSRSNILKITESAIMIALAVGLSLITLFRMPQGGSVTAASMLPIIIISYRHGVYHGLLTGIVYGIIQMFLGFWAPPVQTSFYFALVVFLDYLLAFGVLGFARGFARFDNKQISAAVSCAAVMFLRFLSHYVSGIIIWGVYAPEGQSPYIYSALYNGSYMLFETIITTVAIVGLVTAAPQLFKGLSKREIA